MTEHAVLDPRDPRAEPALTHWLALQRALALAPQAAVDALRADPDPRRALGAAEDHAPSDAAPAAEARRRLLRSGAVLVPWGTPAYPPRLARISDPAPVLSVQGDVSALHAPAVAVVGSRAASAYGRSVARELAGGLAAAGLVVVSGLAHGIDGEAHAAALEAGGRTVAVQACGSDHVYPARHRRLARRIAGQGAVVTELPPGARPRPAYFPLRNRLIAGLARALLVVEARERSGSLVSVRHALAQGAEVFAVPGPITSPASAGPNRLLAEGAWPALSVEQVLAVLALPGAPAAPAGPALPAAAERVLAALHESPAGPDELARRLSGEGDLPEGSDLSLALLELEIAGRVARDRDGRFRVLA